MESSKITLLKRYLLKENKCNLAWALIDFMSNPEKEELVLDNFSIDNDYKILTKEYIEYVLLLFQNNRREYENIIRLKQATIWKYSFETLNTLNKNLELIKKISPIYKVNNYYNNTLEIKKILEPYISSRIEVSRLEEKLGVDRYLDILVSDDFKEFERLLELQSEIISLKLKNHINEMQKFWGNFKLKEVIEGLLVEKNETSQICDLIGHGRKKTITFLLDGWGYAQSQWSSYIDDSKYLTYKENIFKWLIDNQLMRTNILGAPFISDTGAGLAQIFTGRNSKETKVLASNMYNGKKEIFETKKAADHDYKNEINHLNNTLADELQIKDLKSKLYYCTKGLKDKNGKMNAFSEHIFRGIDCIESVDQADRVYKILSDDLLTDINNYMVYITMVDHNGHEEGAYSQFELLEHKKLSVLFRNFIILLAKNKPHLFNNEIEILFIADHGMLESNESLITLDEIQNVLNPINRDIRIVINNRSVLLYYNGYVDKSRVYSAINSLLEKKGMKYDISFNGDEVYKNFVSDATYDFSCGNPLCVIRLISAGLFSTRLINNRIVHYAGHGGCSVDEAIVPLYSLTLNRELLDKINNRFEEI